MRVAVGSLMHESNTFLDLPTTRSRFAEGSLTFGAAMAPVWGNAHHEVGGFLAGARVFNYEAVPLVMAWATPGGPVDDAVLDEVAATLIDGCRSESVDGLLLALHGAMVTANHPDADAEVLRRLRAALGPSFPIVATLDFHANCTPILADLADALVGYQTYPHVDQWQCGLKAAALIVGRVAGQIRPATAIAQPRLTPNLLAQATDREPMRSLMAAAREAERRPGMLSVSVMAGFPYADVPDMGAAVIAVADGDRELASAVVADLADRMWMVRRDLHVPCPLPAEAVRRALTADGGPVLLVDLGDNVGGGSPGDGTVLLAELLRQGAAGAVVVLFAPDVVRVARALGVGGRFRGAVGGKVDRRHGDPVEVEGTVLGLFDGTWVEPEARHGGRRHHDQGPTAILELDRGNRLVLNTYRTPPFSLGQLTSVGIDPSEARVIVVKAAVAYKAAYAPVAAEVIEVDTPGVTAIDPRRFEYRRVRRPLYPLDET